MSRSWKVVHVAKPAATKHTVTPTTIACLYSNTIMHLKHAHAQNMTLATKTTHTHKDLLTLSRGHSSLPNQNQPLTKSLFFAIPLMGRQTQRSASGPLIRRH